MFIDLYYPLILSIIFILIIRYQKIFFIPGLKKWDLSVAFIIKLVASLFYLFVFDILFGKGTLDFDSFQYFLDGSELNKVFYKSPKDYFIFLTGIGDTKQLTEYYLYNTWKWSNTLTFIFDDSKNIIRICSLIEFFARGSFYIYFIIFDIIALGSVYYITKSIYKLTTIPIRYVFYGILILPNFLFWTSGILKEVPIFFGFSLFLYSVYYLKTNNFKRIFIFSLSVILMITFKPYIFFLIILSIIILGFKSFSKLNYTKTLLVVLIVTTLMFFFNSSLRYSFTKFISYKQHDFINIGKGGIFCFDEITKKEYSIYNKYNSKISIDSSKYIKVIDKIEMCEINRYKTISNNTIVDINSNHKLRHIITFLGSNSYIPITPIKHSFFQLILNTPKSLINANFRPLPFDPGKKFRIPAFFETLLVFVFFTLSIIFRKKLNEKEKNLIFFLSILAFTLSLLIGWVTPVLGAIIRYRIPVYLSILLISFILIDFKKIWRKKLY